MRGNRAPMQKAKDFKGAIKRIIKELGKFKILIIISLIFACISAVLSISAPDRLSRLTDKITDGLIIKTNNIEKLTKQITTNLSSEFPKILQINLSQDKIESIQSNNNISIDYKNKLIDAISNNKLNELSDDVLNVILNDSVYKDVYISKQDKINLIKNNQIPDKLKDILLDDIEIDNTKINSKDQLLFLEELYKLDKNEDNSQIYSKIDNFPSNIKKIIEPKMDINGIKKITIFLIIIYIISALLSFIQSIIMATVSNKFARNLRNRISMKINKLPLKYFDNHMSGDILSRVTNDVDTIANSMNQSLGSLVTSITLFLGSLIMMFYTNYIMAITAVLSSIFGFIFMGIILSKSQKYFAARQEELGNLNSHIEEVYSGLNIVKVYNGKKISDKKFDIYNERLYNANRKSQFLSGLMMPFMGFIGNFGYVCVCVVGALLARNNIITFGVIIAFMTYVRLFTQPLSQIAQSLTSLQSTAASSERVFEFLDEIEMNNQSEIKDYLDIQDAKGNIDFNNVVFTYDSNNKPTINNFTAKVKSGQKIAIVGPTGAGKTTIVNLLMKFYDIDSGEILIDGKSINCLTRENVHNLFTMVLQDTWMFEGTIKENIIYNRKGISDEMVKDVCKTVGLHHFIKTLPNGYDTMMDNVDSISQGQRQLLTIARAMVKSTPFLILDEATSNVDTRTEELVQKSMDKLTKNKTSFIIAHRLSTIKNADLILVMKDGNIVEQGRHSDLMKKGGFYAKIYNSQFEL